MRSPAVYHLMPADRTLTDINTIELEHKVCNPFSLYRVTGINGTAEPVDMFQCLCFPAVRELVGEMTGRCFRIGQTVSVVVVDADLLTKQIEFLLYYPEEDWLRGETRHGKRKSKAHRK